MTTSYKRRICLLCIGFVATAAITGCWDRRELNDLAIAVGMGLDGSENGIEVTTQIVNPGEVVARTGGVGYSTPVTSYSATEKTTFEALRKLTTIAPRRIFTSHLRVLVIGESLARQGLKDVLDSISRDREYRTDFYLIVARGTTAKNVLEILTAIEKIPANKMFITLKNSNRFWAPTAKIQLDKFTSNVADPTKAAVLTGIQIIGNPEIAKTRRNPSKTEPYGFLKYTGIAMLKDGKLVDWLTDDESKGYNYIMDNVSSTAGHVECPDGKALGVEVVRTRSIIKGRVKEGKPEITIRLTVEENVSEVRCKIDLTAQETIKLLEARAEEKLADIMESAVRKAKKHRSDIFGFGAAIEDANPGTWVKLRKNWDQHFAELPVKVDVNVQIRRFGTTINPIQVRNE